MGRLPSTWAGRIITEREPYSLYGEIVLAASASTQFPDTTFSNNVNKPFEIHRVIPRVYGVGEGNIPVSPQPDQALLAALVKATIYDVGLDYKMTKNPTRIDAMTKGSSERTWEFADPHYLVTSNQIQIDLINSAFPTAGAEPFSDLEITNLLIAFNFQGFLLTVAPPSDNR